MYPGAALIAKERERQVSGEGYTLAHDHGHTSEELVSAAVAYLLCDLSRWPWEEKWFKPTTARRDLEKAGALLAAAIDVSVLSEVVGFVVFTAHKITGAERPHPNARVVEILDPQQRQLLLEELATAYKLPAIPTYDSTTRFGDLAIPVLEAAAVREFPGVVMSDATNDVVIEVLANAGMSAEFFKRARTIRNESQTLNGEVKGANQSDDR